MIIRKPVIIAGIFAVFLSLAGFGFSREISDKPRLIVFHSLVCESCIKVKKEIMPIIENKYNGRVIIEYKDVGNIENYKLFIAFQDKYKVKLSDEMPVFYLDGRFLSGEENVKGGWQEFIEQSLRSGMGPKQVSLPSVDLVSRFNSFTPILITGVGLVDGVNPCAFTVIVFFMSFLAMRGYRRRELVIIGLSFIFAVFAAYLLIGLGAFSFLYQMQSFWLITKTINYGVGVFSVFLGMASIYDFIKFRNTGETKDLVLQLPAAIKNQIHKVIRRHYGSGHDEQGLFRSKTLMPLAASSLIAGFLVSLLEAVCTGQTYLPTITFILKTTPFKMRALGYLLLYNLMFVVPLLAIFVFALFGVTSNQFSQLLKKHLSAVKILMAILFFSLGAFLIWRA